MNRQDIEQTVTDIVLPITVMNGIDLVDVEYVKEGRDWFLRVYIDKTGGITIDDCQRVSEELDRRMEDLEVIDKRYYLEVSSPGERPLKKDADFRRYCGEPVEVRLYKALNGKKTYEGTLVGLINDCIVIDNGEHGRLTFKECDVAVTKRVIRLCFGGGYKNER